MKRTMFILLAIGIALALTCLHLVQQLREQQGVVAGLQEQLSVLRQAPRVRSQPAMPPSQGLAELPRPTHEPESAQPAPLLPMPGAEEDLLGALQMSDASVRQGELLQDPHYREALRQRNLLTLPRTLPGLREALGLSAEQEARLFELLAEQQLQAASPLPSGSQSDQGADEMRRAASRQRQALDEQAQLAIRELLGDQAFQRWQDYRATLGTRHQVEQMRSSLARSGVVMEQELVPVLVRVLADDQAAWASQQQVLPRDAAGMGSEQRLQQRRLQQERSLQAITPYLTDEQRRVLAQDQRESLALLEGQLNVMRLQREATQRATVNEWAPADDRRVPP